MSTENSRPLNLSAASSRVACQALGVHPETLRRWQKAGKIKAFTTAGGQFRYDVAGFQRQALGESKTTSNDQQPPATVNTDEDLAK